MNNMKQLAIVSLISFSAVVSRADINQSWTFEDAEWGSPDWTLVGQSSWVDDPTAQPANATNRLRLTTNASSQVGNAWLNTTTLNAAENWSLLMRGQVWASAALGGDMMGMGLQTDGTSLNGGFNATHCVFAYLDSYQNLPTDPYANSLKIVRGAGGGTLIGQLDLGTSLEEQYYFNLSLSYNSLSTEISATFDSDEHDAVSGTWDVDLSSEFGSTAATAGFTAWTGADYQKQDVMSATIQGVPEPSTYALLLLAAVGFAGWCKRRRA
jgi:hypothetical protein